MSIGLILRGPEAWILYKSDYDINRDAVQLRSCEVRCTLPMNAHYGKLSDINQSLTVTGIVSLAFAHSGLIQAAAECCATQGDYIPRALPDLAQSGDGVILLRAANQWIYSVAGQAMYRTDTWECVEDPKTLFTEHVPDFVKRAFASKFNADKTTSDILKTLTEIGVLDGYTYELLTPIYRR